MSIKGFPSNQKLPLGSGITAQHATIQPTDEFRDALDVPRFAFRVGGDVPRIAEANTGNIDGLTWVYETATPARRGDFVRFEAGAAQFKEVAIVKVETDRFLLGALLTPPPAATDTFFIMRYATQRVGQDGTQLVSVAPSPTSFVLDGVATQVEEDTGTPANSIPLPVKVLDAAGLVPDFATEATLAAAAADLALIEAKDFATETTLAAAAADLALIEAKDFATETTLAAVLADTASIDTNIASLAAEDFATETTLAAILADTANIDANIAALAAEDFATQATLAAVDTKIAAVTKNDGGQDFLGIGGETQAGVWHPVHVSSSGDVFVIDQGRTAVNTARLSYTGTPVNTTNWQQILASTSSAIRRVEIFDSSGQTLELGVGGIGSEVRQILIFPGGNGVVPLSIASGARVSVRAVSATANEGEISVNFYS